MTNTAINSQHFLLIHEVAERLRAPASSVRFWIMRGKLKAIKAGRRRLVTEEALAEFLSNENSATK